MNLFTRIICLALLLTAITFVVFKAPVNTQSANTLQPVTTEVN